MQHTCDAIDDAVSKVRKENGDKEREKGRGERMEDGRWKMEVKKGKKRENVNILKGLAPFSSKYHLGKYSETIH